ncbi:hypothetical protein IHN32_01275 [Deinococcus sp. 14RED07]|uniref:hypothetical protein n=1 Tax=unclassified Deinococcus TaxID=2623546 RepID=UPI001E50637F|nr:MULTISPECIES: hypothetical protein [unclassified Deinococcus]MCD0165629.1 hypothetical protein [Deinococcus sp. 12RED42]MCD0174584.1 hypothetical protein [Deinococcus sp. 14RED07]
MAYLLLICLSSVTTCMYLFWQGFTYPDTRGPEFLFLPFAAAWATGAVVYGTRLFRSSRPAAGRVT